jgi:uncharacterized protein YbjT (DUF2867 family)
MQERQKILVTGSSGFIGRFVIKQLLSDGFSVRALVRNKANLSLEGVEIVVGNMSDRASLSEALKDVDGVVHLAAVKLDESNSFETNVIGAKNLIDAVKENGVRFIINISSSSTKIKEKGKYALTKSMADEIIMGSSIPATTLKPSIVYSDIENAVFGSLAKFANLPITPVIGNGKCKFYPINIEDLAKIISISINKEETRGKTYDIGGPDTLSINEIIESISKDIFGKKRVFLFHIPRFIGFSLAKILSLIMDKPPITRSNILGSTQDISWDKETAFRDFDFKPRSFNDGVLKVKKEFEQREAEILYKYIYSSSGVDFNFTPELKERYDIALKNNGLNNKISLIFLRFPFLIGSVDIVSKFLYPQSSLQRRLLIVSSLCECDTQSADWLLPKDRDFLDLFFGLLIIGLRSFIKIIVGIGFLFIPGFIKRHAN